MSSFWSKSDRRLSTIDEGALFLNPNAEETMRQDTIFCVGRLALGVFVAAFQIWASKKQAITAFEDTLSSQYRDLIQRLPIEALLGENLDDSTYQEELIRFYHHIDVTNFLP